MIWLKISRRFSVQRDQLLRLSLVHALNHGFNEKAINQACQDLGISGACNSLIQPIELVHTQMRSWNREIIDKMSYDEKFKEFKTTSKIKYLIKERLLLQQPYINRWNEAMALGAKYPQQTAQILWQYADDSWFLAGDQQQDAQSKRALFLYIYISTELHMLTDRSPGQFKTWEFMERKFSEVQSLGECYQLQVNLLRTLWNAGYYFSTIFFSFPNRSSIGDDFKQKGNNQ